MAAPSDGPEMVSLRELARRLAGKGVTISHQRLAQLAQEDPNFPPVTPVGRAKAVDWLVAWPYFKNRTVTQGQRTDILKKETPPDGADDQPGRYAGGGA